MKILILLLTISISMAKDISKKVYFCEDSLESLPIQQNGRVKPLYVHATQTLKYLTGKNSYNKMSAVKTFCLLSINSMGIISSDIDLKAKIEHVDTKKLLGLESYYISYNKLLNLTSEIRPAMMQAEEYSSYRKSLQKLLSKINLYQSITSGQNWLLADYSDDKKVSWVPISNYITETKAKETSKITDRPILALLQNSQKVYIAIEGDRYLIELNYAKAKIPYIALCLTLLALAFLTLFKKFKVALIFSTLTLITQTIYIILRIYISQRAPVTNMYETVLFSGYGALFLAMIIGHFKNDKTYLYMGLGYNVCTLFMTNFATGMLSSKIGPLVPVLRDNFWLSTHVTSIIISYGALALSWILANTVLFKELRSDITKEDRRYYSDTIYTCLKFGTILLAAGIILGGVWADYSWGRFWGWDPKETWSLIVLCIYMAILHGRYTSWITDKKFIPLVAVAFLSVLMAWFGVNYILASGLHSYGFSEGGAVFLGSMFLIQFLILAIWKIKKRA